MRLPTVYEGDTLERTLRSCGPGDSQAWKTMNRLVGHTVRVKGMGDRIPLVVVDGIGEMRPGERIEITLDDLDNRFFRQVKRGEEYVEIDPLQLFDHCDRVRAKIIAYELPGLHATFLSETDACEALEEPLFRTGQPVFTILDTDEYGEKKKVIRIQGYLGMWNASLIGMLCSRCGERIRWRNAREYRTRRLDACHSCEFQDAQEYDYS